MKTTIGLIRVLTLRDKELLNSHGSLIEAHFPDLRVISRCIDDQPEGIHDEETKRIAIPKIFELGKKMVKENINAIIVSCCDDPGVYELRTHLDIPVIEAGSSAALLSRAFGSRIGALGITVNTPRIMKEILAERLIAEIKPENIKTSLDLITEKTMTEVIRAGQTLQRRGAEVITFSCTGYSTIGSSRILKKALHIPIIDAVLAAGLFTWYSVKIG